MEGEDDGEGRRCGGEMLGNERGRIVMKDAGEGESDDMDLHFPNLAQIESLECCTVLSKQTTTTCWALIGAVRARVCVCYVPVGCDKCLAVSLMNS